MESNGKKNDTAAKCPVCGAEIHGRAGKRFCSEKCRSLSHAERRYNQDIEFNKLLVKIRLNRRLLKKLCRFEPKVIVSREVLVALEFDPAVFTSVIVNAKKQRYYFNGEFGILPITRDGTQTALIVRRETFDTNFDPWE